MPRRLLQLAVLLLVPAVLALGQWLIVRPGLEAQEVAADRVTVAQAREMDPIWIDARSAVRYREGHIPGALPLTLTDWETQLAAVVEAWTPEQAIVVYCGGVGCDDSSRVAERLRRDLGAEDVWVLEGGIDGWRETGGEVTSGAADGE